MGANLAMNPEAALTDRCHLNAKVWLMARPLLPELIKAIRVISRGRHRTRHTRLSLIAEEDKDPITGLLMERTTKSDHHHESATTSASTMTATAVELLTWPIRATLGSQREPSKDLQKPSSNTRDQIEKIS
jgi:hypothetical protein